MKKTEIYKTLGFSNKFIEHIESDVNISDSLEISNTENPTILNSNYWDLDNVIIENSQESQNMIYNS